VTDGRKDGNLAIEVTYGDGEARILLAHWRLVDIAERVGNSMFLVEARCGCRANMGAFLPCSRHIGVSTWRVIDATAPTGRRQPIR
jgi:hypothetical protein